MKYLRVLLVVIFFISCRSTKIVKNNDSALKEVKRTEIDILEVPASKTTYNTTKEAFIPTKEFPINTNKNIRFNHDSWENLLQTYVSKNGEVNYKGFKNSHHLLVNYINSLSENMPTIAWTREDKLAFWINAYNAMTIDLVLRHYPINSIKDIEKPWEQRHWKLQDKWYNLNEIEHEILRKMNEPRIHFAIVCASISCPKLANQAFTATNLDEQLNEATKEFLNDSTKNNVSQNNLKLSKVFQWFAKDFKANGSLIDFLNTYSTIKISGKAKKSFKTYNWDLNE